MFLCIKTTTQHCSDDTMEQEAQTIERTRKQWRDAPPSNDPYQQWSGLRGLLYARAGRLQQWKDLEEVIQTDLSLLLHSNITGIVIRTHAKRLAYLAVAFSDRYTRTLRPSDNSKALYLRRLALAILPDETDNLRATIRSQLALSLLNRADERRNEALLDEALSHAVAALASNTTRNGISYQEQLDTVANIYRQRYLLCGNSTDLNTSIDLFEQEIELNPDDMSSTCHNLSYSLSLRFKLTGKVADIHRAVELGFRAIEGTNTNLETFVDRARNLVDFLETRYLGYKDPTDIQRARQLLKTAIDRLGPTSSRFTALSGTLSRVLRVSYEISSSLEDLEAALIVARKGVDVSSASLKSKSTVRNELALLLAARYRRLGQECDAHEALQHYASALTLLKPGDLDRRIILSNMACTYDDLNRSTKEIQYLERAITLSLEAMTLSDVRSAPSIWLNGANFCSRHYATSREIKYLSQGMGLIHQALGVALKTKSDDWAQMCMSAGIIYELKHRRSGEAEDFNSAVVMYVESWSVKTASLHTRLKAITLACDLLIEKDRWSDAWHFLQDAVELIPLYCASSPDQQDQQYMASELSGITARACTAGLVVGDKIKALHVWEQGRGMIVSASYHGIEELSRLRSEHPDLHEAFSQRRVAAFQGSSIDDDSHGVFLNSAYLNHQQSRFDKLALLKDVVQSIRNCAGFQDFLYPVNPSRMQSLAGEGAIVVLNASKYRMHAILVTKSRIDSIELSNSQQYPQLLSQLNFYYKSMTQVSRRSLDMTDMNSKTLALLSVLWDNIVKPVCEALGFTTERLSAKMNECPANMGACRIRWMTSGTLSRLPLHVAGFWAEGAPDVLPKMALSSYAASFRVLAYASQRSKGIEKTELCGLIASMERPGPDVPYRRKGIFLNSAERESQWIQAANSKIQWRTLVRPSADRILMELPHFPFVHFATHGVSDPNNPSEGHLVLMKAADSSPTLTSQPQGTTNEIVRDNLSVSDIFRCTASNAVLAFLAACSTADVPDESLADENLHIVNAFQIAGFPHVIGSLWPANNLVCPTLAKAFYSALGRYTNQYPLSNDLVAFAINYAVMTLIVEYPGEPRLWAGFVHMGP